MKRELCILNGEYRSYFKHNQGEIAIGEALGQVVYTLINEHNYIDTLEYRDIVNAYDVMSVRRSNNATRDKRSSK